MKEKAIEMMSQLYGHFLVRRQYSGNAHGVIAGIGLVICVYARTCDRGAGDSATKRGASTALS